MKLGLVTVLYSSPEVLPGFFDSLSKQADQDWHLEVIDNSPNEATLAVARECAALARLNSVNFVYNAGNFGVAKANNQGIQNCLDRGCEVVILLNNDIEFEDVDLIGAVRADMQQGGHALLAPRIHYFDSGKIWYGGGRINLLTAIARHEGKHSDPVGHYLEDGYTGYAPTCFLAIRSDVFKRVGMMDERYFVYYDDTDFVLRCLRHGFKLRYMGQRVLLHKVSSSTGGDDTPFSVFYGNRNRLFFIRKHLTGLNYGFALFWYFLTRGYKWIRYSGAQREALVRAMREGMALA